MSAARPFFGGNWKMHKGPDEARAFLHAFAERHPPREDRTVVLFPPAIALPALVGAAADRPDVEVGVQDVHQEREGAHTGAISASMAAEAGARWGLAGHSERRREFGDDDERVARKVDRLLEAGVAPVLCVGETLEQRDAGRLQEVLHRQVSAVVERLSDRDRRELVIAYEPVWAIGTGRTASPEDAAAAHELVRKDLAAWIGDAAEAVPIIYGGSVKPANAGELLTMPGVDGALVGGASLDPEAFASICAVVTA
ncbi:MAG: triose-phosphate isomerase [Candidatus Palauibacterales bacterium]|nr:triose-phosphate isomerase [Candidatus Palauibacterales bacterium]MDP2529316.1 triose-phosphate isomerase [Candidatus Palauibacterales bacterium]MDP2583277.1 triose-phosphate isomerase [Candidatus Palauibacterales bacterium]